MPKSFKQFMENNNVRVSGGQDNGGGQSYDVTNSDGTISTHYVPGKHHGSSSSTSYEHKPEPKHPLQGKKVTATHSGGQSVTGKLVRTEHGGTTAVIKNHETGMLHFTDAKTVKKA